MAFPVKSPASCVAQVSFGQPCCFAIRSNVDRKCSMSSSAPSFCSVGLGNFGLGAGCVPPPPSISALSSSRCFRRSSRCWLTSCISASFSAACCSRASRCCSLANCCCSLSALCCSFSISSKAAVAGSGATVPVVVLASLSDMAFFFPRCFGAGGGLCKAFPDRVVIHWLSSIQK